MCKFNILDTTPPPYIDRKGVRIIKPEEIRLKRMTEQAERERRLAEFMNELKEVTDGTRN